MATSVPPIKAAFVRGKGESWRRTSIISKLTLLVVALGLPLCAILAFSLYAQFKADRDLAQQSSALIVNAIATRAEAVVKDARSLLASIALRPAVQAMDRLGCDPFLSDIRRAMPGYTNFSTLNLKWEFVCNEILPAGGPIVASRRPQLYERMLRAGGMVFSEPLRGQLTGNWIVIAAFPVRDENGRMVGAATATLDLARLGPLLGGADLKEGYRARLTNADGYLLMNIPDRAAVGRVVDAAADIAGARSRAPSIQVGADSVERIHAYAPVRGSDWVAMAALPTHGALAESVQRRTQTILAVLLVFMLAAWAVLVVARRITRPLRELEQDAHVMAGGSFGHRSAVEGPDEVGQVAAAFNDMGRAVQEHEASSKQAARESGESQRRLNGLITSAMDAIVTVDGDGLIVQSNPAAHEMFGYAAADLASQPVEMILPECFDAGRTRPGPASASDRLGRRMAASRVVRGRRKGGEEFDIEASVSNDESTGQLFSTAILRDITERARSERHVRRLNRVHAVLTGINALIVRVQSRDELFEEACRVAVDAGAFRMAWIGVIDPQTLEGQVVAFYGGREGFRETIVLTTRPERPESARPASRAMREARPVICNDVATDPTLATQEVLREELLARGHKALACFPLSAGGKVEGVIALFSGDIDAFDQEETRLLLNLAADISFAMEHIEKQARLDYLAYYDALTGLANRTLFLERVGQALRAATRGAHRLALFLIDIERFKNINDGLGRLAGDSLLRQVAEILTRSAGDVNLVAHLDADHFAVLLPEVSPGGNVEHLLEKGLGEFQEHPFQLDDTVFRISAKVGVAVYPGDGADPETLFRNAEAALKQAKATGERYLFHAHNMTKAVAGRLTLENRVRRAVQEGEFLLHYQPQMNLVGDALMCAEALIRWNDPAEGLVPTHRFTPILEETGLILEVGRWMLRQAIEDHLRWAAAGMPQVRISLNVSRLQFRRRGFVAMVEDLVGVDPRAAAGLELEIAESLVMEDVHHSVATLGALRALGVRAAIDDFGIGFSSLSCLARLPVDTMKIHPSFVADMTNGPQGLALVSTFINLAHSLKLCVVAQGVESAAQARLLVLLGCDEAQGGHFSEPLSSGSLQARFLGPASHRVTGAATPPASEVPISDKPPR
ncbi:MAG: EAL domain-containing protein [Usitatibacter sp.]